MAKPTYWELLKHPNWQRKRLEVMERDGFECTDCGADNKTLNVHHTYYEKGLAPWEYPSESLKTLCEECHRKAQDMMTQLQRQIGKIGSDIDVLFGFALALEAREFPMVPIVVSSYEVAEGIGCYWALEPEEVIALTRDSVVDGYALNGASRWKRGLPAPEPPE